MILQPPTPNLGVNIGEGRGFFKGKRHQAGLRSNSFFLSNPRIDHVTAAG